MSVSVSPFYDYVDYQRLTLTGIDYQRLTNIIPKTGPKKPKKPAKNPANFAGSGVGESFSPIAVRLRIAMVGHGIASHPGMISSPETKRGKAEKAARIKPC